MRNAASNRGVSLTALNIEAGADLKSGDYISSRSNLSNFAQSDSYLRSGISTKISATTATTPKIISGHIRNSFGFALRSNCSSKRGYSDGRTRTDAVRLHPDWLGDGGVAVRRSRRTQNYNSICHFVIRHSPASESRVGVLSQR